MLTPGGTSETPTPTFLDTLLVATWLAPTAAGPAAFALIAPSGSDMEPQLHGLAADLALRPSRSRLRESGERVLIHHGEAMLLLDWVEHRLQLPPVGGHWAGFVLDGGPVCIVLGLDPLPTGADRAAAGRYLAASSANGRALMGIATLARRPDPCQAVIPNTACWQAGPAFPGANAISTTVSPRRNAW